ncbi:MBL fold metallo-hydrolase [Chitinimonas sp. BJB300]|uniref:MBL fold metallo-hydrolase n=1 Tax=Chitinimonas sp. BJB300 TaxID=1559339 RepID=UPI000C0FEA26|nr:MBL fold metallo-hydrolase [Chitinimonas sp. BJB300]PHV11546.1 MBL fold metallo-hydrolase [Chitinimonas sp. BJB300]TSJ87254.1 MBL fold metallo-hydrolase [Chitinimonas sp. BJB300]
MFRHNLLKATLTTAFSLFALAASQTALAAPADLDMVVYNPGKAGIFPVSSELIIGKKEAILIDAQFSTADGAKLVEKIKQSGKKLTTIYISHGDPDFYFGLEPIRAAFPQARIVATQPTIDHIRHSMQGKLAFWGPKLGENAPKQVFVPSRLKGNSLTLEGKKLEVIGLKGPNTEVSFVWIPALKAVVGGVPVVGNEHVWMADAQTKEARADWLKTLQKIEDLKPEVVVPGHFSEGSPQTLASVHFTRDYIKAFEREMTKAKNSAELIAAMKQQYPQLEDVSSLELSAKVVMGEMKWPAE